jgi:hypothetical protein
VTTILECYYEEETPFQLQSTDPSGFEARCDPYYGED